MVKGLVSISIFAWLCGDIGLCLKDFRMTIRKAMLRSRKAKSLALVRHFSRFHARRRTSAGVRFPRYPASRNYFLPASATPLGDESWRGPLPRAMTLVTFRARLRSVPGATLVVRRRDDMLTSMPWPPWLIFWNLLSPALLPACQVLPWSV
jgi:hypothetical protein